MLGTAMTLRCMAKAASAIDPKSDIDLATEAHDIDIGS